MSFGCDDLHYADFWGNMHAFTLILEAGIYALEHNPWIDSGFGYSWSKCVVTILFFLYIFYHKQSILIHQGWLLLFIVTEGAT